MEVPDRWFFSDDGVTAPVVEAKELSEIVATGLADAAALIELPPHVARAVPKRRKEYVAGRMMAAAALTRCGCSSSFGVAGSPGCGPDWPAGFVGSITHGGGLVAAAAARTRDWQGLGIDTESIMSEGTAREIVGMVVEPAELAVMRSACAGAPTPLLLTLAFSAKESLYKCIHPLVREFFGFEDARIVSVRADTEHRGILEIALLRTLGAFTEGRIFEARYTLGASRLHTAVGLPPLLTGDCNRTAGARHPVIISS